ncbi:hypothetical protein SeMB42_g00652 [Synchytrium endobioticum]|uniref:W2 domain-containing protein n=1 Tax=Synchytrium endobioticum TaxID=286115 RepID=A0A507D2U2_9FUNG|nr:hypothetical protein SeLEV6574_g03793 [Synchytrium endobioticum]TPX53630.1 hypothetical protein SeMB42_g00652 [Synchytrium endobioticum]
MATINIGGNKNDKFHRYKMPRLVAKVEGKGNGIKTVLPNMADIAKSLDRPPSYPTKFFGCELGAQVTLKEKEDKYIVNGAHDAAKLQELLEKFIQKFVLCSGCENPETNLTIEKDGTVMRNCIACGTRSPVDMRHKLVTFIQNHPPEGSSPAGGKKGGKKAAALAAKKAGSPDLKQDELPSPPETPNGNDHDDAEEVTQKVRDLSMKGSPPPPMDDDDDEDGEDPLKGLAEYFALHVNASDDEILSAIGELGIRDDKAVLVIATELFDTDIIEQNQIHTRAPLLSRLVKSSKKDKGPKALLGGIERLVGVKYRTLLPRVAKILHMLYEEELLTEDVILAWAEKSSKKFVDRKVSKEIREHAAKFIDWLKSASEEEDDDDEDNDDQVADGEVKDDDVE